MKYIIAQEITEWLYVEYLSKYYTQEMLKAGDHNAFTTDETKAMTWPAKWLADRQLKVMSKFPKAKVKQVGDMWGEDTETLAII